LQNYKKLVFKFAALMAISCIGGSIKKYWSSMIRLRLRTKVTLTLHQKLFEKANISNYLNNISRQVDNVDQRVAADVEGATLLFWDSAFAIF
jgi:ABC-type uncharacterized transport system fused permease/ATPase subunit